MTEIIDPKDPPVSPAKMTKAKRDQIRGLLERGTFSAILLEDVSTDGNVLPRRFVLAIMSAEDGEIKFKAPFRADPALYKLMADGLLVGLSGGYVYDLLHAGFSDFRELSNRTNKRFKMGEDEELPHTSSIFSLARDKDRNLEKNQHF